MSESELGRKHKDFEVAILIHSKSLYHTAIGLTRDHARAQDLTQETFLKAYKSFESFKNGTNSFAWLSRIMVNTFINNYHRSKREVDWDFNDSIGPTIHQAHETDERAFNLSENELLRDWVDDEIRMALNKLPDKYRKAVIMFDLQGHTYQEIAETLNCAVGTVKSRLFRGRNILKKLLKKYAAQYGWDRGSGDIPFPDNGNGNGEISLLKSAS
ncbi:MAG: sigma-70 family RNA polymerase sigma factor [candidate division Zixibacteria bacterium]|nr:sigma-70 family RNA polymerase sigma factor [candidate division Zixibacteria bacterium]